MVARHPVATMLLLMFGVGYGLLIPPALTGMPLEPFLLGAVLFGQLLPAVAVTGAAGGRPAVRDLFRRVFRWRVHVGWYLLALLGVPIASLLGSAAVFGPGALHALITDPSVIAAYLASLTILPVVNLWEEMAWMGVVQARLSARSGPLTAALLTGPLFGALHLPLELGRPAGAVAGSMVLLMVAVIPLRMVLGWFYDRTGGSILLVAVVHATFNATNNTSLLTAAAPDRADLLSTTPWIVVALWAAVLLVVTRGRLRRRPSTDDRPERAVQPQ
jgi:membrane protease YdiL (CAAX protease family)